MILLLVYYSNFIFPLLICSQSIIYMWIWWIFSCVSFFLCFILSFHNFVWFSFGLFSFYITFSFKFFIWCAVLIIIVVAVAVAHFANFVAMSFIIVRVWFIASLARFNFYYSSIWLSLAYFNSSRICDFLWRLITHSPIHPFKRLFIRDYGMSKYRYPFMGVQLISENKSTKTILN